MGGDADSNKGAGRDPCGAARRSAGRRRRGTGRQADAMTSADVPRRRALVAGVTGISGGNLTRRLLADGWDVAGLCRHPQGLDDRITPVVADLQDAQETADAVRGTAPTHVFFTTWSRRST